MSGRIWPPLLALLGMAAANAGAADVDLAKASLGRLAGFVWEGRTLSQVLQVEDIERLVLLKAVTSAPATLDMHNLRRMLRDAAGASLQAPQEGERHPLQAGGPDTIWEAVLLTRTGGVFGLSIRPGETGRQDHRHRACLVDEAGQRGCFDIPAIRPE